MSEEVPVLLIIFNRPENTQRVVDALRTVKPKIIFVAADGPRRDRHEDGVKCRLTRQAITEIDWPCDIQTRFQEDNLGCDQNVASAIGWFFEHVEYGIILEDDCVPHPHLFPFCGELFNRYADDTRIMQVSGFSPYIHRIHPFDYHFSRAFRCWGWGTWRRAWSYFKLSQEQYGNSEVSEMLKTYFPSHAIRKSKYIQFCHAKTGNLSTANWDFAWNMACFSQNGLCIVSEKNLITNIGFDQDATHTRNKNSIFTNIDSFPLDFPLRHPLLVFADGQPERSLGKMIHRRELSFKSRCGQQLRHVIGSINDYIETIP